MPNTVKNIKLIQSPFHPNVESVDDFIMKLHAPYSDNSVTIKINPYIAEYRDKNGENIRQLSVTKDTADTKVLFFDFKDNNVRKICIENKSYEIKLMNIVKISEQGQTFPVFEFLVTSL